MALGPFTQQDHLQITTLGLEFAVSEILGASVSTDSPSTTSQDKMQTESNIKSTAGRHTKNFFIYTPRKKACNANNKKIKIRTLFLVSYGYA